MFAVARRELHSERTLLGAVVIAGVSVSLLLLLILVKSNGDGSRSAPATAENFTIAPLGISVPPPATLPANEQATPDGPSAISINRPAFPGKDFSVPPTTQDSQTQPSESNTTASAQGNADVSDISGAEEGTGEQQGEDVDLTVVVDTDEPAKALVILGPDGTPIALPAAGDSANEASPFASAEGGDSVTSSSPFSSAPVVPVEPDPEPQLVGLTKLLPEFSGASFLPDASELVGDSMFGDSTFDGDSLKETVRAVITTVWGDLSLVGADVFGVPNSQDTLNFYRRQLGGSDWTLYADVEGVSSALMYVLDDQTLVIATLDVRQMQLVGQESEGLALMLFDNT